MTLSLLTHHVEGEGETILLLNGGFMTYGSWEPVAARLRGDLRLLLCDLRGQLLSPGPSHHRLEDNVEDIEQLLDRLEIDRVHVLGASFGGFVGMRLAAASPKRVLSLIAATTSDIATPQMVRGAADLRRVIAGIQAGDDPWRFHELLIEDVYSAEFVADHRQEFERRRQKLEQVPSSWYEGLVGILRCTETVDLRPYLGKVECPALVVHAARDRVIPRERSEALATGLSAELVEHPTSGHALVAEDPVWLADRCLEFLHGVLAEERK